jgi:hypothetical protein
VRTSYGAERKIEGNVQMLLPQVEEQTRAATARIVLPNTDRFLRPGMFVEVSFASQVADDAVLVPDLAVLRSGERNTVFLALDGGFFEPREVQLGARSEGGLYQVLAGLKAGERVVTSGQFMLDSESQLREAIQKMLKPASAAGAPTAPTAPTAKPVKEAAASPKPALSESAVALLTTLAGAGADAAAPLAADDLAGYHQQLAALRTALTAYFAAYEHAAHGPLAPFKDGLAEAADLAAARRAFAPLSTALADFTHENGVAQAAGLHVFSCSMAKAHWLQRTAGTKNPFYGAKMLTCGEEIPFAAPKRQMSNNPAAPQMGAGLMANLPPGHPPIDAMTLASFTRSQMGLPAANAGRPAAGRNSCGNCGMSAAAMTAGEPGEHEKK